MTNTQPTGLESRGLDQRRSRVELRAEGEAKVITGYAAVFYVEGDDSTEYRLTERYVERVLPEAFDAIAGDDVRCLVNHNENMILGRTTSGTLRLVVDDIGLRYECDVPDTTAGRDLLVSMERGDITGSSFQFRDRNPTRRADDNGDLIRELRSLKMLDVSPVTYPAYEATSVESARRSLAEWDQEREAELQRQADARRRRAAALWAGC